MMKFAFVNTHGEIKSIVHPSEDTAFTEGEQVGEETVHGPLTLWFSVGVCSERIGPHQIWQWRDS